MIEPDDGTDLRGVSKLAEEFRELERRRRAGRLPAGEVHRYHAMFGRLSDALASGERRRRMDARQFLRVLADLRLVVRTAAGESLARCLDFGGGGCSVAWDGALPRGAELRVDGALLEGHRYPLAVTAEVVWLRPAGSDGVPRYGLRFELEGSAAREQIDRVLYRVLDLFLDRSDGGDRGDRNSTAEETSAVPAPRPD